MNRNRRKKLKNVVDIIGQASTIISSVMYEEQDSLDNTPENLMDTDRYSDMEDNIDKLESINEALDDVMDKIRDMT